MRHTGLSKKGAEGLKILRERIDAANIPSSILDESFNLATWNIRDFGKKRRSDEAIHFIAEILNQFDLIAITELRKDVTDLSRVMQILGGHWKVIYSDFVGDQGGNWERIAYLYDKRMINFTGLASEADPPRKKNKEGEYLSKYGWWRNPYMASFQAGTFDFTLLSAHMRWGEDEKSREKPLKMLAKWVKKRSQDPFAVDHDIIVMGDFNIPSTKKKDKLFQAITSEGLQMPPGIRDTRGSNLSGRNRYDQILHMPAYTNNFTNQGGVLDIYCDGYSPLFPKSDKSEKKLTWEISDHLPLWIQVNSDNEEEELEQLLRG